MEVDFEVQILQGDTENVCPAYGDWHYVGDSGSGDYSTASGGFASPDDDTSQQYRQKIVDDEQAKLVNIEACYHRDENCDPVTDTGCEARAYFRGFKATWENTDASQETLEFGDCSSIFTESENLAISEEVMYFTISIDGDDIDGLAFQDYAQN